MKQKQRKAGDIPLKLPILKNKQEADSFKISANMPYMLQKI